MYARVARWDGADAQGLRSSVEEMRTRAASGPPEGVPAVGFTMLLDADAGTAMAITLFETEEDLRKGDETLRSMDPPEQARMRRVSVETFEVGVDIRQDAATTA